MMDSISELMDLYQPEELEELPFDRTEAVKTAVFGRIRQERKKPNSRWKRGLLVAAVLAAMMGLIAAGVMFCAPVMQKAFGVTATEDYVTMLDASDTMHGWTLSVKECTGDSRTLLLGLELTAPERTAPSYLFDTCEFFFPALGKTYAGYTSMVELEDMEDTGVRFVAICDVPVWETVDLRGQPVQVTLRDLKGWVVETQSWEEARGEAGPWTVEFTADFPESETICVEPNRPVHTLGVEAVISRVEISPVKVAVTIEGEQLKGHHRWGTVPPYACASEQVVTLYTKEGERLDCAYYIRENKGAECSGGSDPAEPGALYLTRMVRSEEAESAFLDLSTLERIEVCGVSIPLDP